MKVEVYKTKYYKGLVFILPTVIFNDYFEKYEFELVFLMWGITLVINKY